MRSLNQDSNFPVPATSRKGWPWDVAAPRSEPANDSRLPRISIVTPSYNQGKFLEETIRSVLLQGYPNLEYIVIDGGSTDESVEIIKKYERWISYWISERDSGQSDAINKGFSRATGDVFGWLNSDDTFAAGALELVGRKFTEPGRDFEVLVGDADFVYADGRKRSSPPVPAVGFEACLNWRQCYFLQPACFFSGEAWRSSGGVRTDLHYCMDLDLWLKMAKLYKFERVQKTLAQAKCHDAAKTFNADTRYYMFAEMSLVIASHGGFKQAKATAFEMADELIKAQGRLKWIMRNPLANMLRRGLRWYRARSTPVAMGLGQAEGRPT